MTVESTVLTESFVVSGFSGAENLQAATVANTTTMTAERILLLGFISILFKILLDTWVCLKSPVKKIFFYLGDLEKD